MLKYPVYLILSLMLFLGNQTAVAQTTQEYQELKREIESLKQGQAGLKKDLQEIKKLIQGIKQPAAQGGGDEFKEAIIDIRGAPIRGDKKAKLVFIEFTDYQ